MGFQVFQIQDCEPRCTGDLQVTGEFLEFTYCKSSSLYALIPNLAMCIHLLRVFNQWSVCVSENMLLDTKLSLLHNMFSFNSGTQRQ